MASKRDYYEVLGVDRNADESSIKKAYRNLAMQYHPDRNHDPAAVEKMKELNEAYAVLSDPQKKARYDRYGHAGLDGMSQEDIFRDVDFGSLFREFGFGGSIFDQFFGGGRRAESGPRRGRDLKLDLDITLEEVASGVEKSLEIPLAETCKSCRGSGAAPGGVVGCDECRGTGQKIKERQSGFTIIRQVGVCAHCCGRGQIVKEVCKECHGKGQIEQVKKLTVKVPRGVEAGETLRMRGEGEPGEYGAQPGDLYIVVAVQKHPVFERHGDNLLLVKDISFAEAALGGEVTVPSLNGDAKVIIPEGTQTGSMFRVHGHGMPRNKGMGKGDLYVSVKVVTPTDLSDRAKELLRQLADLDDGGRNEPVASNANGKRRKGDKEE
ncbi:MAG: molecular chaperone DnaJ [Chloroflexi bacterium]|nr:molecular chaperone DnaJ [Chloroflexota bacterium]